MENVTILRKGFMKNPIFKIGKICFLNKIQNVKKILFGKLDFKYLRGSNKFSNKLHLHNKILKLVMI